RKLLFWSTGISLMGPSSLDFSTLVCWRLFNGFVLNAILLNGGGLIYWASAGSSLMGVIYINCFISEFFQFLLFINGRYSLMGGILFCWLFFNGRGGR
ncbi:hypothetical protein L9F63_005428, partial [Diploptera punctata]